MIWLQHEHGLATSFISVLRCKISLLLCLMSNNTINKIINNKLKNTKIEKNREFVSNYFIYGTYNRYCTSRNMKEDEDRLFIELQTQAHKAQILSTSP